MSLDPPVPSLVQTGLPALPRLRSHRTHRREPKADRSVWHWRLRPVPRSPTADQEVLSPQEQHAKRQRLHPVPRPRADLGERAQGRVPPAPTRARTAPTVQLEFHPPAPSPVRWVVADHATGVRRRPKADRQALSPSRAAVYPDVLPFNIYPSRHDRPDRVISPSEPAASAARHGLLVGLPVVSCHRFMATSPLIREQPRQPTRNVRPRYPNCWKPHQSRGVDSACLHAPLRRRVLSRCVGWGRRRVDPTCFQVDLGEIDPALGSIRHKPWRLLKPNLGV